MFLVNSAKAGALAPVIIRGTTDCRCRHRQPLPVCVAAQLLWPLRRSAGLATLLALQFHVHATLMRKPHPNRPGRGPRWASPLLRPPQSRLAPAPCHGDQGPRLVAAVRRVGPYSPLCLPPALDPPIPLPDAAGADSNRLRSPSFPLAPKASFGATAARSCAAAPGSATGSSVVARRPDGTVHMHSSPAPPSFAPCTPLALPHPCPHSRCGRVAQRCVAEGFIYMAVSR